MHRTLLPKLCQWRRNQFFRKSGFPLSSCTHVSAGFTLLQSDHLQRRACGVGRETGTKVTRLANRLEHIIPFGAAGLLWSSSWWLCRLGPCPGMNVDGKMLSVESRGGIEIPPPTLQTPLLLGGCSSQRRFWWSCFCRRLVFALPKEKQRLLFLANLLMMLVEVKSDLLVILICLLFHTGVRKGSAGMAGVRPATIL